MYLFRLEIWLGGRVSSMQKALGSRTPQHLSMEIDTQTSGLHQSILRMKSEIIRAEYLKFMDSFFQIFINLAILSCYSLNTTSYVSAGAICCESTGLFSSQHSLFHWQVFLRSVIWQSSLCRVDDFPQVMFSG